MRRTGWLIGVLWILGGGLVRAQTAVVIKAVDTSTGATTDLGDATAKAIRVMQVPGGTVWTFNWTQLLGAAPSATNPMPSRLTDGTTFIDPRSIRALTSGDVVTIVQPTGSNLHVVVDTAPTTAVTAATLPLPTGAATAALQPALSVTATGTVTNPGDTFALTTTGMGSLVGTLLTGPDLQSFYFEGTIDGTDWMPFTVDANSLGLGASPPYPAVGFLNTDGAGVTPIFRSNIAGFTQIRVRKNGGTSASQWKLSASPDPYVAIFPVVKLTASDGTYVGSNGGALKIEPTSLKIPGNTAAVTGDAAMVVAVSPNNTPVLPSGAATSALQTTGNTSLASIDTKTPALGQALAAASSPVVLTAAQITTLTPPAALTNYANETGGNLAAIKTDVDKIPAQGQALAAASLPVVLTAAQITTLTPPTTVTVGSITNPVTVTEPSAATATNTFVGALMTETTLLAANAARKGFIIVNQSGKVMLLKFGTGIGSSSYTAALPPGQSYAIGVSGPAVYTGTVTGIWFGSDGGGAVITEL